jgi:plasmid maintenance system antidote protein VapI
MGGFTAILQVGLFYPGGDTLGVSRKTLSKIINGNSGISPEIAFRLSIAFGGTPESWMGHQVTYDLWQVEQHKHELNIKPLPAQELH